MGKHDGKIPKPAKRLGADVIPVDTLNSLFEAIIAHVHNACLNTM